MTAGSADDANGTGSTAFPGRSLPRASVADTLALFMDVVIPTLSKGVLVRRPRIVGLAQRMGLDDRAVRRLQKLRTKYGDGPLLLSVPGRSQAVILAAGDVFRVLDSAPEPFAPATMEKRAALAHFEPKVALASHGPERAGRRAFNEAVLDTPSPVHRMADRFVAVLDEEAAALLRQVGPRGELVWDSFCIAWYRMIRRVFLGDQARDDHLLTDMLEVLRSRGNWAFLRAKHEGLRAAFHARLAGHLERAEPGSLAGLIAATPTSGVTAATHQVAQWLFASDPAGMATFRALALLAAHPEAMARAHAEIEEGQPGDSRLLPFLRACFHESLRLWPTTPAVLRETTREVAWPGGTMPANTSILIFAPFFHRDDENFLFAHRFNPDLWLEGTPDTPLIPFSRGPAVCPATNLVPMLGSAMLAAIIRGRSVALRPAGRLEPVVRLPGTLDNYTLRFRLGR